MRIGSVVAVFALSALVATGPSAADPIPLVSPAAVDAAAQIGAARETERELESALREIREKLAATERGREARARLDVEVLEPLRIVNGVATIGFPNVGALLKGDSPATAGSWCTGTLIGCRLLLTANHCFKDGRDPASYQVFFQNAGFVALEWISAKHPDYSFPHADLALVRFATPIAGIPIGALNRSLVVPPGMKGKLVGFGRTGGLAQDYGVKRQGMVKTAACDPRDTSLLCWDYDDLVGLPGTDSNTCNADSGGPLWIADSTPSRTPLIVGVTSGGTRSDCLAADSSYDVDVRQFVDWIVEQGGAHVGDTACGSRPLVGVEGTTVLGGRGELSIGEFHDFVFQVPPGVQTMIVAMNGTDNRDTNLGLFVRRGSAASAAASDCAQNGTGNYGACTFDQPAAGEWYVRVDQQGQQRTEFQLVVTTFEQP